MTNTINVRNPYYIRVDNANLVTANLYLYVWSGVVGDEPSSAQYTITKSATTPSTGNPFAVFEIAELIRDYLITEYGSYSTDIVWAKAKVTLIDSSSLPEPHIKETYLAADGFGYFEQGISTETVTNSTPEY